MHQYAESANVTDSITHHDYTHVVETPSPKGA